ncbi:MAG: AI-2E family transporter [Bacteroidetes bacterium]|nr:AI-2E family transporter [Bacteroidota bacterium]
MYKYFSIQRFAYLLVIICLSVYILIVGQSVLAPVAFSIFFAYLIQPVSAFLERWVYRIPAILLAFIVVLLPLLILVAIFGMQFVEVFKDMPALWTKIQEGLDTALSWLHERVPVVPESSAEWTRQNSDGMSWAPLGFIQSGITSSTTFLANTTLTFIYTFLFLLYRGSVKNFILIQFEPHQRDEMRNVLRKIKDVVQQYLNGLGLVILILFGLNSLSLWAIGINYPVFWGGLAAVLAVIPYIGSFLGGLLPFLYSLATTDTVWQPLTVAGAFIVIQALEGNIITPKVVGSAMKINPFVAIFSLIVGGSIWGVAGLILALPAIAIVKVIFSEIDYLKPVGLLLSSHLNDKESQFMSDFDDDRYRLKSFLKPKKED